MEVLVLDAPGGAGEVYQCPTCSRTHPAFRTTSDGEPILDSRVPAPAECQRCGGPMDVGLALAYQDAMAAGQVKSPSAPSRRTAKA